MQAKTSKAVTRRQASCQFLLTALETQGPLISDMLQARLRPALREGDLEPTPQVLHIALGRFLEANLGASVQADEAAYQANAGLTNLRKERSAAVRRLARQVIHLRTLTVGRYQAPLLELLGLGTQTVRTPVPLLRQADRITEAFADEKLPALLGEPFEVGEEPPQGAVVELGARAAVLRNLLHRIDEAVRLHDVAREAKNAHLAEHDLMYTYTARTFEAFCRLAGKAELAERVRKTIRSTRRANPDAASGGAEPGAPASPVEAGVVSEAALVT